jgi:hypothetical protein
MPSAWPPDGLEQHNGSRLVAPFPGHERYFSFFSPIPQFIHRIFSVSSIAKDFLEGILDSRFRKSRFDISRTLADRGWVAGQERPNAGGNLHAGGVRKDSTSGKQPDESIRKRRRQRPTELVEPSPGRRRRGGRSQASVNKRESELRFPCRHRVNPGLPVQG